jgi:hypothetical protein
LSHAVRLIFPARLYVLLVDPHVVHVLGGLSLFVDNESSTNAEELVGREHVAFDVEDCKPKAVRMSG